MTVPYDGDLEWLDGRTILLARHGSHAYGTSTPESDVDLKGIAIPPPAYYFGFTRRFEQAVTSEPYDMTIFEIAKFFRLAADCNPGILEVLWAEDGDYPHLTALGERVLERREDFLSKKVRYTFSGYAMSQLKRIRSHRRWLLDPPAGPPSRADYGLPERTVIPKDQLMAAEAAITKKVDQWNLDLTGLDPAARTQLLASWSEMLAEMSIASDERWRAAARTVGYDDNFIELLERERHYKNHRQNWRQYVEWCRQRNEARAQLEANFGYDTKHAMHLVRLMRMCREILDSGRVLVRRPDAAELLAIRRGAWSYDELIEWAEAEMDALDGLMAASPLPVKPDREALDRLCCELVAEAQETL